MFAASRWNPFDDIFSMHRYADQLLDQVWSDRQGRSLPQFQSSPFQVRTSDDGWRLDIPMPGIDPAHVAVDVAGDTISVRAEQQGGQHDGESRYQQTIRVPRFLDLDRLHASHRHGMLELTLPLKESVRPRRIQIEGVAEPARQLTSA